MHVEILKLKTELNFTAFHYKAGAIHLSRMTGAGFWCHSARGVSDPLLSSSASLLSSLDFLSIPGTPGCAIKSQSLKASKLRVMHLGFLRSDTF